MVDPGEDFQGYMEYMEQTGAEAEAYRAKLAAHELWRQTTWAGWLVRQIQAVGGHFAPFFISVANVMSEEETSPVQLVLFTLIRAMIIAVGIGGVYAISNIAQKLIGREYVIDEDDTVLAKDDKVVLANGDGSTDETNQRPRRGARDKKQD